MTTRTPRRPDPRPVRARRILVLVVAATVAVALAACSSTVDAPPATTAPPTTEPTTTTTEVPADAGEKVYVYEPEVGDCFDQRTEEDAKTKKQVPYYLLVDCSLPHESEVFAVTTYRDPNGERLEEVPFPGDEALRSFGKRECPGAFADYVGLEFERSKWILNFVVPTSDDWPGDTTIACTLQHPVDKRAAGSARGSRT